MAMMMIDTTLPWSGAPALMSTGLREHWAERLGADARFLPRRVALFCEPGVPDPGVEEFVSDAAQFLFEEMAVRSARVRRLAGTASFEAGELEALLTNQTFRQSWAIYFAENGGLPLVDSPDESRGVIPCSSMRNHGVGWLREGEAVETWLLTARKPGEDWDMDSDVGHESAHAAFAPVPLFVKPGVMESVPFSLADVRNVDELRPEHLVRLLYFYSELAVVAIRGESRPTHTRLPIADPEEVFRLVAISEELFPDFGFTRAKRACERSNAYFDPEESDAIFDLAAPVLRLLPRLNGFVNALGPPTLGELKDAVKLEAA
jgi:hypothetical protein